MMVSPRAQYLYGKIVVDIERSPEATRPAGAAVDPGANASHGDVRQAEYYQQMLQDLRIAVEDEVSHHCASLAVHEANGDLPGVRRSQRIIRVKETELAAIYRLIDALSSRFPTSQMYSPDLTALCPEPELTSETA
ncbi:MAG: hypothetical protein QOD90_4491 [Mycobacterium sp.]|jgi:hypothetical protein|nr:hypothetical protein [Mycobacterium sp.]